VVRVAPKGAAAVDLDVWVAAIPQGAAEEELAAEC